MYVYMYQTWVNYNITLKISRLLLLLLPKSMRYIQYITITITITT